MEQRIIKLQIANEYIMGAGVSIGAVGSHDDVLLEMDFRSSAQWAGTTRRAIFANALGENRTPIILTTNLLAEGQSDVYLVPVPAEAKNVAGECFLTVEGYIGEGESEILRVVTEEAAFRVLPSKLYINEDPSFTPSQAEQIQAEIDEIKTDIVQAALSASSAEAASIAAAESAAEADKKAKIAATCAAWAGNAEEVIKTAKNAAEKSADNAAESEKNAAESEKRIENMTVTGETVPPDSGAPAVEKSENEDGSMHLHFSIRQGESGVYVGSGTPPAGCRVQVDPNGGADTGEIIQALLAALPVWEGGSF